MNGLESDKKRCRVCLDDDIDIHWGAALYSFSDMTYKDCYYKYTLLEYFDEDNFPKMLCRKCSNGLEYIDTFISKAIETHILLKERIINKMINDGDTIIPETNNFETIILEDCEIKPEIQQLVHEDSSVETVKTPAVNKICSRSEIPIWESKKEKNLKCIKENKSKTFRSTRKSKRRKFIKKDERKSSKKWVHPTWCTICSKVLSSKYRAITHEKTHIKNRERNETCEECGLRFFSKQILKSHMLTHNENREKTHKCEFCDKAFYNRGGLNIHRRIHLGQMVSCTICTKEFYRQIDLDKHMNSHSALRINSTIKTKPKFFIRCKDCGKSVLSTNFKFHHARHKNEPLFRCSICNNEFFSRKSCVKHLKRTHKKANEDVINFIIVYKTNRYSHLYLEQNTNIQVQQ